MFPFPGQPVVYLQKNIVLINKLSSEKLDPIFLVVMVSSVFI